VLDVRNPRRVRRQDPLQVRRGLVVHVEQIKASLPENLRDVVRVGPDLPAEIDGEYGAAAQRAVPPCGDAGGLFRRLGPPGDRPPAFQEERESEGADDVPYGRAVSHPDILVKQNGDVEAAPVNPLEELEETVRPPAPLPPGVEDEDLLHRSCAPHPTDLRTSRNQVGIEPFRAVITNFPHAIVSASYLPSDIMPFADEDYRLNSGPRTGLRPWPAYRRSGTAGAGTCQRDRLIDAYPGFLADRQGRQASEAQVSCGADYGRRPEVDGPYRGDRSRGIHDPRCRPFWAAV